MRTEGGENDSGVVNVSWRFVFLCLYVIYYVKFYRDII